MSRITSLISLIHLDITVRNTFSQASLKMQAHTTNNIFSLVVLITMQTSAEIFRSSYCYRDN